MDLREQKSRRRFLKELGIGMVAAAFVGSAADAQSPPRAPQNLRLGGIIISSVSGTVVHGQSLTIRGIGFGTKTRAAPLAYDDFSNGTAGQPVSSCCYTNSGNFFTYDNSVVRGVHALSARHTSVDGNRSLSVSWGSRSRFLTFDGWSYDRWQFEIDDYGSWNGGKYFSIYNGTALSAGRTYGGIGAYYDSKYPAINRWGISAQHDPAGSAVPKEPPYWMGRGEIIGVGAFKQPPWKARWVHWTGIMECTEVPGVAGVFDLRADVTELRSLRMPEHLRTNWATTMPGNDPWIGAMLWGNYFGGVRPPETTPPGPNHITRRWSCLYTDDSWARVELADSADWGSATLREIQIPTRWEDESITVTVNQGLFVADTPVYLFVVNPRGAMSRGYGPLVISRGAS